MERKTILVTGASSGIGASTAKLLSENNRIILCGRNFERLECVKNECNGSDHMIWSINLEEIDRIEGELASFIKMNNLVIDGFVHCAGMIKYVPVKMFSPMEFGDIFNVNVVAPAIIVKVLCSKRYNSSALRSVVFVSSNIRNLGAKAHCLYSSSKAALDGLMRSLAMELAPKVRVNSVLPGAVETRMTQHVFSDDELVKKMEQTYPLGLGHTLDVANAIEFLIGEQSSWITGQQITVDGGRTINLTV